MFLSHWNAVKPGDDDDYAVFRGDGGAAEEEIYTDKTGRAYAEDIYEPELPDADISERKCPAGRRDCALTARRRSTARSLRRTYT